MEQSDKSSFCVRPFNSVVIKTDGSIRPCCQIKSTPYNLKTHEVGQYWSSDYLSNLRQKFLQDEKPDECKNCWDQEKNMMKSHRNESNSQYGTIFKKNYLQNLQFIKKNNLSYPEDVELNITNICNLSCQMCTGKFSSKLLIENNYLEFEKLKQSDYDLDEKIKYKIEQIASHDLKLLNLIGGEPLVNKNILTLLEKLVISGQSKKITLHITTNGTTCNAKIIKLLRAFKNLRIMFSMESVGKYNDYMRYPSNWQNIEKNINQFKTLDNAYPYINATIQNLNILYLEPLIEFAHINTIFLNFSRLINPLYLEFDNLPINLLKKSYDILNNIDKDKLTHTKNVKEIINLLKIKISNYTHDKKKFATFTDMIRKRDQYRKISIKDYMPEIYNII